MVYLSIWAGMAGDAVMLADTSVETSNWLELGFPHSLHLV